MAPSLALAAASLDSQLGFAWESPSPARVAAISDCFIAQAGQQQAKHRWGPNLACTTRETSEPGHPVDSYRPCGAPPPCPCTADPPWRAEVGGQGAQPVLAADWPG